MGSGGCDKGKKKEYTETCVQKRWDLVGHGLLWRHTSRWEAQPSYDKPLSGEASLS